MSNFNAPGDLPSGDIRFTGHHVGTDRLPPSAQEALEALRERVSDVYDLVEAASRKRERARADRDEAERIFKNIAVTHRLQEGHSKYDELKGRFDKAHKNFIDVQDRGSGLSERWQSQKRLLTRVETYVKLLRSSANQAPSPSMKVPAADRLLLDIDKQRNEIATLFADRHETLSKATPSAEIKARARAEIEEMARRGRPDVTRMVNHGPGEGVAWPDYEAIGRGSGMGVPLPGDVGFTRFIQAAHLPLIAWLFKDRLLDAINAEIDANSEDDQALSVEQRVKKLAEIDARILAAERIDVALVRHTGGAVDYREETDPRALLGIEGPAADDD
ncbi:hypothetical protein BBJ66_05780 [Rhizobium sp. RSm-3]|nr:hypothetical protein BBJ66_05780 [Rhizobium sp. RSm-3]